MESLERRIERLEYYQRLMFNLLDNEKASFYRLIVEANLTKEDVDELFKLCENLSNEYQKQKAEGLVFFTPLLTQFVGLLHPNLDVGKTVEVLLSQRKYVPLMNEFRKLIEELRE